ncbi:ribosome-recycling factor [Candidatus Dependentiae bacterium Noda2021]|nr:ribosome-recycling factor [Candidatus Dependentiae bacterium Noda2021]
MLKLVITENDSKSFQNSLEQEMQKPIKHFETELLKIRTGRAHTSLIEDVMVVAYGNTAPLKQLAVLSAPEAKLLTIQPWDPSIIEAIEKGLQNADLGITPLNDGKIIRIQLPDMSSNRREELIKILGKKLEECRVSIRNVRRDFNNFIRDAKKDKQISENFFNRLGDVLQDVTDKFIKQAEQLADKKEKDIRTV